MRTVLIALAAVCFLLGEVFSEDKYTTKYDNVDIDVVLNTERLLNGYVNCLLDQGPCTPDAAELKSEQDILYKLIIAKNKINNFKRRILKSSEK